MITEAVSSSCTVAVTVSAETPVLRPPPERRCRIRTVWPSSSHAMSSCTAVTVTVCHVLQAVGVKVSVSGETEIRRLCSSTSTVTSPSGGVFSRTL